jgi:hypothetical protein
MIRMVILLLLVSLLVSIVWIGPWLKRTPKQNRDSVCKKLIFGAVLVLVLGSVASGRLNWLFALLGVLFASLSRLLPLVINFFPHLQKLWTLFQFSKNQKQNTSDSVRFAALTRAQALEILGLKPGATEQEIIAAHRKLISRVHPDKGGSDYLAAQINLAKQVLLQK